ncbi:MAG: CvpA family protein [Betaproteobacteria bacterium]|nr:CvpA family protein [Betaproteobacteria bacterium]
MNLFDYTVIAIVVLSALLGWWRGLVYEVLALLGWVAAYAVARLFAAKAAPYIPAALGAEGVRTAAAFAGLFIGVLIIGGIVAWLLSKLVKWVGLGWMDGLFGALFGVLRGVLVVLALVLLAGLTGLPKEPFWRNAASSKPLVSIALAVKDWLPESVAQRVHY